MKVILIIVFLHLSFFAFSQTKKDSLKQKLDSTEYYQKLKDDISFWAQFGFNDAPLNVSVDFGDSISTRQFEYKPNPEYLIGIGLSYKGIGLSVGFRIPVNLRDEKYYGKTNYWDIAAAASIKNFLIHGSFRKYKGFALSNLSEFDTLTNDSTMLRNDIVTHAVNAGVTWFFFKNKYNYGCAKGFAGIHTKTSWSPYANMAFTTYGIKAESGVVPRQFINDSTISVISKATTYGIRTVPGIAFILSTKGFNMNINAGLGLIWQYNTYKLIDQDKKEDKFTIAPALDLDFDIGYNHRFWVIRLSAAYNMYYSKFESMRYFQNYYKILLTVGGRVPIKKKSKSKPQER